MKRSTAIISPLQDKLVLGGSVVIIGDSKGQAALAQINLSNDMLDYTKILPFATSVTTVAHSPK